MQKIALLISLLLCSLQLSHAQTAVKGIVHDHNGRPLEGAVVLIKGTTKGTSADHKGRFSLPVSSRNATLIFRYLGYIQTEVAIPPNDTDIVDLGIITMASELVCYGPTTHISLSYIRKTQFERDGFNITGQLSTLAQGRIRVDSYLSFEHSTDYRNTSTDKIKIGRYANIQTPFITIDQSIEYKSRRINTSDFFQQLEQFSVSNEFEMKRWRYSVGYVRSNFGIDEAIYAYHGVALGVEKTLFGNLTTRAETKLWGGRTEVLWSVGLPVVSSKFYFTINGEHLDRYDEFGLSLKYFFYL